MHFIDWLLVALPLLVILWVGFKAFCRRDAVPAAIC